MFQTFEDRSEREKGPERLRALRAAMGAQGLQGWLVPRADMFRGEYVAPCDERLAWLTGFTGSAGFAAIAPTRAGVFVDGRYRTQLRAQVDTAAFTPLNWPEVKPGDWLREALPEGGRVGFDPWLHTPVEIEELEQALEGSSVRLVPTDNLIDRLWHDRPPRPAAPVEDYPTDLAGRSAEEKCRLIAAALQESGQSAAVLTLPDSISWLLNIRGADIPRVPVVQAFAIIDATGAVQLFTDPAKGATLPEGRVAQIAEWDEFLPALIRLGGTARLDPATAPLAVLHALEDAGIGVARQDDPCLLPKACKTEAEIAGARTAHQRDGAAVVSFLAWFDSAAASGTLTEIDVVKRLESCRRATGALRDISFDTIAGSGPHGAIVHYRVTHASNRRLQPGELLLLDSGGQYRDGTTDITRTLPIGRAPQDRGLRRAYTRVLQGMIALARARWPRGLAGRDLDPLARAPLWRDGLDYDHGTGHGVGHYLSVHEGPQRISRTGTVPLAPGMILSDEPGHYREGKYGIRIENLLVVREAVLPENADRREMLEFETLTLAPIDTRLLLPELLTKEERDWLNSYHARVLEELAPLLPPPERNWLARACAPLPCAAV